MAHSGSVYFYGTNYSSQQTLRVDWSQTYDRSTNKSTVSITGVWLASESYIGDTYYADFILKINGQNAVALQNDDGNSVYLSEFNAFKEVKKGGNSITGSVANIEHGNDGSKSVNITLHKNQIDYAGFWRMGAHFAFTDGDSKTIDISEVNGSVRIGNGTSVDRYMARIGNGTSPDLYIPYIGNGTTAEPYIG